MKIEEIKKLCKKHKVEYHHHDQFTRPVYAEGVDVDLANAVVVVYSERFGRWQLAVNEDGSVSKPGDELRKTVRSLKKITRELRERSRGWKRRVLSEATSVSESARKRLGRRRKAQRR